MVLREMAFPITSSVSAGACAISVAATLAVALTAARAVAACKLRMSGTSGQCLNLTLHHAFKKFDRLAVLGQGYDGFLPALGVAAVVSALTAELAADTLFTAPSMLFSVMIGRTIIS